MPRILVADDEPNIREVISFALERAGFVRVVADADLLRYEFSVG